MFLLPFLKPRPALKLILVVAFTTGWLHAAPYGPDGKAADYRQPDGTTVGVRVFGDEYYAVAETLEGYTVVYDKDKVLTYGNLSADGKKIVSTGIRASNKPDHAKLQNSGIKKSIRLSPEGRKAAVIKGLQRMRADKKGRVTPQSVQYYSEASPNPDAQFASPDGSEPPPPPPSYAPPAQTRLGNYVGLCILVDFSDQPGTIASSAVDDYCNKPGYTGYNNAGSIYDYFFKQSGGRLRYNNIVTAYVRVPNPKTYYDDGSSLPWGSSKAQTLVIDALNVLMAQGFDFTKVSRNASGVMYSVNVFYAGTCASAWSTGLWPGAWAIPTKTVDAANGIKAYSYQMTDIGTSLEIGTFCHENGHMLLDYPDLYPYDGNAANFGNYSLMSGGNHADGGRHPTNIDPYLKNASGWTNIVDLNSTSHQRCTIQADSNLFYRYRNPAKLNEYFIFEVRDNTGYEGPYGGSLASVNPSAGLVAYHVREDGSNTNSSIVTASNPNCVYTTPYEILLVEANQQTAKTPWYDDPTPDTSDAFKSTGKSEISDITTPDLKFWDATGRNTASGAVIHSISADGPTMTFVAGAGTPTGSASIVLSRTTIDSFCDFGNTAAAQTFSIGNGGGGTLSYSISNNQTWLSCTPASGTATTECDTITVDFSTSGLAAGSYSATITVTDPLTTPSTKNIAVNLTVNARPVMALSVASITKAGIAGSSGPQASFAIRNTGGGTMNYAVSKTQPWLSLTPSSGTVVAETDTIYINFNATSLARGTYNDTITITSAEATNSPLTIPVTFAVDGADMIVSAPNGGESWVRGTTQTITWGSGIGGNVKIELLKNSVINTTISASTPNDGSYSWTIPAGQAHGSNYRMRITSVETPTTDDLSFEDFEISAPAIYTANMDTNPGWTLQGAWAWGDPTGASGDPQLGYTGTNVIGYNLAGAYTNSLAETHATTPAIDCSNRSNVQLSFYRWLGIERGDYDKAYVRVSNNGTTWTNVFAHNTSSNLTSQAAAWSLQTYDISAVADGAATVYVRWTMGTTDGTTTYSGWNIDDVIVDGKQTSGGYAVVATQSGGTTSVTEGGTTDTYTLHLAKQPSNNVTVNITPDSQVGVSSTSLTFTSVNWATPQTITVNATNDTNIETIHTGTINHSATSSDPNYNAIDIDGFLVTVTDNDNTPPSVNAGTDQAVVLTGAIWLPSDLPSQPLTWYDATDPNTVVLTSGVVSQWSDKTATAAHLTQGTAANRPTTGTTINGRNSIAFDGSNDSLKSATNPFGTTINNAFMAAVVNLGSLSNSTMFSLTGSPTNANRWQSHAPFGDGNLYFDCGGGGVPNRISGASGWAANQNKLLGFYSSVDDAAQEVWANGTRILNDATGHAVTTLSGISFGFDGTGSYDQVRFGESIIINGTITAQNRQKLEGYLAHKWALLGTMPVDHPYKTLTPSHSTVVADLNGTVNDPNPQTITTTWSVVSGPAAVTFADPSNVDTTATFTVAGVYVLRLAAADGFDTTVAQVTITVNATTYPVAYNSNGSTSGSAPANQSKVQDTPLTLATNTGSLARTGHSLTNWNSAADGTGVSYGLGAPYAVNSSLILYPIWTPDTYAVTYNGNSNTGGTAPANQTKTYAIDLTLATNSGTLTRTNFFFSGWNTAVDGSGTDYPISSIYSNNNPVTLYAKWIPSYIVNYNGNGNTGGTVPGNQTKVQDVNLTLSASVPARTGYTFAGWNTALDGSGTAYAAAATYTSNAAATLYAQWTINTWTVTYNLNSANSGFVPANQIKTYGIDLTLASNSGDLARTGYTFSGWNTASNGNGTNYTEGAIYPSNAAVTLYAKWTLITFPVSYDGNGNTSGTAPSSQAKSYLGNLTLATNSGSLARTGYVFSGWNTAADGSGTNYATGAAYSTNASLLLYAKWIVTYPVTYDGNGSTSGTAPANQFKTHDVSLSLSTVGDLARTGYYLVGWNTAADGTGISYRSGGTYTTNTATTLYAEWSIHQILFRDDFDSAISNSLTAPAGRATGSLAGAVTYVWINGPTGVVVDGLLNWDNNASRDSNHQQTDAGNIQNLRSPYDFGPSVSGKVWEVTFSQRVGWDHPLTFGLADTVQNGVWNAWDVAAYDFAVGSYGSGLRYDVDAEGGANGPTVASVFPSPPNTIDFHHFRIRFDEPAATVTVWVDGTQQVSLTTLDFESAGRFLSWGEAANFGGAMANLVVKVVNVGATTYTVVYDGNGQTGGSAPTDQTKNQDVTLTLEGTGNLIRSGYTFTGWNTAANGSGTAYAIGASYTANAPVTLYAQWTAASTYAISYDGNGNTSGTVPVNQTKTQNVPLPLSGAGTLVRLGYIFAGWNTASDGSGTAYAANASYTNNTAITLFAQWTANTYAVTYNGNSQTGGTAPANQTKTYGVNLTLSDAGTLVRIGYTFAGWNTVATGTGTAYPDSATYVADAAVVLYAQWTANSYTVSFDANGGSASSPTSKSVTFGSAYGTLATTSRIGYTFNGWFTATFGGTNMTDVINVTIAANHSLYAKWTATTYAVTYDGNGNTGGTAPIGQTQTHDVTLTLANPGTLVRSGQFFAGWNTAADGSGTAYPAGAGYIANAAVILYAQWTAAPTYTITYNGNGNTGGTAPVNQIKTQNVNLPLSDAGSLVRTGYSFAGWNTAANGTGTAYNANDSYTANVAVTLFAQWTINPYSITFDSAGGSVVTSITQNYGSTVTAPSAPTRSGYTFSGWNPTVPATMPGNNLTVTAQWTANPYTISFNSAGGTAVTSITQNFGTAVTAPTSPTRDGYTFASWSPAVPATMPAADLAVTAQWTVNTYTVTFDANGGGTPSSANKTVNFAAAYGTLATTSRANYTFNGWFTAATGGTQVTAVTTVTNAANHSLYAQWSLATYVVAYDGNGNTGGAAPINQTKTHDLDVILSGAGILARTNYTFAGWNTAANGSGTAYAAGASYTVNAAVILYAQWTGNSYTVTYDANGGNVPIPTSKSVTYGSAYGTLASVTRTGYTLAGWFTAASGGTQVTDVTTVATAANHILYAQWTGNTYTVTFDKQSGAGGSASVIATYGSAMPVATAPTRTGYTFGGYYTQVSGGGTQYYTAAMASTSNWDIASATTLFAKWTINSYTLTYAAGAGGTLTGQAVQSVEHGTNGTQVTAVPNSGYNFVKWSDNVMTASRTDTNVTADLTVSASFVSVATVPNVIGLVQATAQSNIVAANLTVGTITNRNHATIPAGSVITQNPSGGSIVITNSAVNLVVSLGPYTQSLYATSDVPVSGTVVNTYTSTQASDNIYETITEIESGGNPNNRFSYLEHKWTSTLAASNTLTFNVEAHHTTNTEGDDFQFSYSTNGVNGTYTNMLTVSKTTDNNTIQTFTMPAATSGTVHVRVVDLDRTAGRKTLDTLSIDRMYFLATVDAPTTTVPNVVGLAQSTAETDIYNASLLVGTVTTQNHVSVPAGNVISQTPVGATSVLQNSAVNLVVSSGPTMVTVSFDENGGSTASPANKQVGINTTYGTLATTSRVGYTFNGWFTATTGGTEVTSDTLVTTGSNHTLYARWTLNSYTITFDSAGGSAVTAIAQNFGTTVTSPTAPTRSGYTFASWSPVVPTTMPANNVTVTAQWTLNTYTLNYAVSAGGTLTGQTSQTVNHSANGSMVTAIPNAGYNFVKWSDDVMTASRTDTNITAGLSLTANFALINYTSWAGGTFANGTLSNQNMAFDFDGDGLATGVEWVIGGDPTAASDASDKKPVFDNTTDPDYFLYSYRRTDVANTDAKTSIAVEYGNDLSGWTTVVDDGTDLIITPSNDFHGTGVDKVEVKIKRTLAPSGKLFTRLKVVVTP